MKLLLFVFLLVMFLELIPAAVSAFLLWRIRAAMPLAKLISLLMAALALEQITNLLHYTMDFPQPKANHTPQAVVMVLIGHLAHIMALWHLMFYLLGVGHKQPAPFRPHHE